MPFKLLEGMAIGQAGAGLQPDPSSMAQELRPIGALSDSPGIAGKYPAQA